MLKQRFDDYRVSYLKMLVSGKLYFSITDVLRKFHYIMITGALDYKVSFNNLSTKL